MEQVSRGSFSDVRAPAVQATGKREMDKELKEKKRLNESFADRLEIEGINQER